MSAPRTQVPAGDVPEGSTLPGLGNLYVFDVDPDPDLRTPENIRIGQGLVCLTCHDADGEECYVLLTTETLVEIS